MDRLDTIFRPQIRQAEQTDTRMAIRHREDEPRRKFGKKEDKDQSGLFGDDKATVSVQDLRFFLEGLLKTQTASPQEKPARINRPIPAASDSDKAARAAQAYQRTYNTAHPAEATITPSRDSIPDVKLTPDEIQAISQLITDLKALSASGATTLSIRPGPSLLQSFIKAVAEEKSRLQG